MKIYFSASISQKEGLEDYYQRIYKILKDSSNNVYSGSLFKDNETYKAKVVDQKSREKWYHDTIQNIASSDLVIIEISYPSSANVGHELSLGLEKGKPVVALYKEDRMPAFLQGMINERLFLVPYNDYDLEKNLKYALNDALEQMDVRFNFFVSPKIVSYLDWIAKKRKIPRAVYLRRLIEEDMKRSKEFEEDN